MIHMCDGSWLGGMGSTESGFATERTLPRDRYSVLDEERDDGGRHGN